MCSLRAEKVLLPDDLEADEAWLIGECACRKDHQFPGYMEKLKNIKTIRKFAHCPGIVSFHDQYQRLITKGTPYEIPDQITIDGSTLAILPDLVRQDEREAAVARREGRMSLKEFKKFLE